jgi:hypothetical protein
LFFGIGRRGGKNVHRANERKMKKMKKMKKNEKNEKK